MMGNSSSLHLAIIYIDLSLFLCQLFGHAVSSPLWWKYSAEVKPHSFLQPTDARAFFWKANKYTLPCGIRVLFEVAVKIEVGRMQLPEDTILYRGHNSFAL